MTSLSDVSKYAAAYRAMRAIRGLTLDQMGALAGISGSLLSRIETGQGTTPRYVQVLTAAAGFTLSEFDLLLDLVVNTERRCEPSEP